MTDSESDDVLLSALLDGELSAEEAARLEQRIAREPTLRARLDLLERTDKAVHDRYAAVVDEPLPHSLRELLSADGAPADNVVPLVQPMRPPSFALPMALAASVTLAIGVALGIVLAPGRQGGDTAFVADGGIIPPGTALFEVLESLPSAESSGLPGDVAAMPVLTFSTGNGAFCREVDLSSARGTTQMLACRRDGEWRLQLASYSASAATDGVYRPATGPSPALDAAISELIDGAPLDAADERELIARGWEQ